VKYAFMTFSCPELTLAELFEVAKRYGYDGIEPRIVEGHAHGIEWEASSSQREAIRRQADESGVALACLATSCTYADPKTVDQNVEETRKSIDLASDVGAPCIRVFGGKIPEGIERADAIDDLVKALSSVAEQAAERGVAVCLETHDDWCNPDHVAEVIRRVNNPAIAVNWDIMHPIRLGGATMQSAFETLRPFVRHVHFHDGVTTGDKLDLVTIGEGQIDHRTAVHLLMEDGYKGYLSGEWIDWMPWETHLPRELAVMKGYEAEVGS